MASFDEVIDEILQHEGGWVNNPRDPGGATKFGLSYRFLKSHGITKYDYDNDGVFTQNDLKVMPVETAKDIYRRFIWEPSGVEGIEDIVLCAKVFDMVTNLGPKRALRMLQETINAREWTPPLVVDSKLGPATLAACNTIPPDRLIHDLCVAQATFYRTVVALHPAMTAFLKGWLRRAAWPEQPWS